MLSIQKHTGLSTVALESAVNSLALAAQSTETVCRLQRGHLGITVASTTNYFVQGFGQPSACVTRASA